MSSRTVLFVLLVWTGSRTGAGMFVVGVMVATYGRLGRTVLYFPLVLLALYASYKITLLFDVGAYSGFETWGLFDFLPASDSGLYLKVGRFVPGVGRLVRG